jgi:hypothetical protein
VSVLSRKRPEVVEAISVRARLMPVAKNARPMAENAGRAARDRANSALAWAMPHVDNARVWAAPHVERTGIAVRDSVAPKVTDLMVATARRLENAPPKRRRWPRRVATMAMLAAAASAVAAVAIRRRNDAARYSPVSPVPDSEGPTLAATMPATSDGDETVNDPEVNGQHRMA